MGQPLSRHAGESPAIEGAGSPLARCEAALELMLMQRGNPSLEVEQVLADDPTSACAHCLRAALIVRADDAAARAALAASIVALERASPTVTDRTRRHAHAARAWLEGDPMLAVERYDAIVTEWPHDVLALAVAHALDFRLGRRRAMRERLARVLRKWNATMPGYASVLAIYAFALEESGHYRRAEKLARRALTLEPRNPYAIHVIAHVMEMQGRTAEGIRFLTATEAVWRENSALSVHLAWHRALFELDADNLRSTLAIYDTRIASLRNWDKSDLADGSALLWRLQLQNVKVKERWEQLADRWEMQALDGARPFYIVHAMMAFVAAGRSSTAARLLEMLRHRVSKGSLPEEALAFPFCEALLAFVRTDYPACVTWLERVRHIASRCGGSLAQCDLIHLTFTEAALRARSAALARALVNERKAQKPSSNFNRLLVQRLRALPAAA